MVAFVLVTIATFLYGTFAGWVVHWTLHQRWSGFIHIAHMNHHLKQYPPSDLVSDRYRSPGTDNGLLFFTPAIVLAFVGFVGVLHVLGISVPLLLWACFEALVLGVAHDWLHTLMHLRTTRLLKSRWFCSLIALHFYHHINMRRNLGIYWFGWDRVLGTFRPPPR